MSDLNELARLLKAQNDIAVQIGVIIGRPAERGHIGEYIAERGFGITLAGGANHRGSDGHFASGPLAGRSVNVKWYGVNQGTLDMARSEGPDYYLVLSGPTATAGSSRRQVRPLTIERVYLFEATALMGELERLGVAIGTATSVRQHLWATAEIYPACSPLLELTEEQREQLALFHAA